MPPGPGFARMIGSLGESLIDFTPMTEGGRLEGFRLHPGGSPYNVALGIARLGHPAAYVGKLSLDPFGELLARRLAESGVSLDLACRGPEPTALAFVAPGDGEPRYDFRLEGTAACSLRPGDLDLCRLGALRALHFGSLAVLVPPARNTVLDLVRSLRGRVLLSFDPNLRPEAVPDRSGCQAILRECLALADLVRLSERDLATWGEEIRPRDWRRVVVLTHRRGCRILVRGTTFEWPAAPCRLVDAVGAGDAFTAGLLVGLAEREALDRERMASLEPEDWRRIARLASATAALTCERRGADPPRRLEVEARLLAWTE